MKIRALYLEERPRERCLQNGPECLSLRECLALLIGSGPKAKGCLGLADDLLERLGSDSSDLEKEQNLFRSLHEGEIFPLTDIKGLGPARKTQLLAALEIAKRYEKFSRTQLNTEISTNSGFQPNVFDEVVFKISRKQRFEKKEWIGFVPAYSSYELGEFCLVERGVRSHINFDPKTLFSKLLALSAAGYFLIHNHPSDRCRPSAADRSLTEQLKDLSRSLNTPLLGHCIVGPHSCHWMEV